MARARKTLDVRTRTAFHEAGHAVLSAAIANPPEHVTIRADGDTLGRSCARMSARPPPLGKLVESNMTVARAKTKDSAGSTPKTAGDARAVALLRALRADPKLAAVVAAYEEETGKPGGKFGKNGLKAKNGKLFALFTQGALVVKLPKVRVEGLVSQGVGNPFDPGHGRLMKEWVTLTSPKASWIELAKEAHEFVSKGKS